LLIALGEFARKVFAEIQKPHFPMFDAKFHPRFGLPVVPAMGPTLSSLK